MKLRRCDRLRRACYHGNHANGVIALERDRLIALNHRRRKSEVSKLPRNRFADRLLTESNESSGDGTKQRADRAALSKLLECDVGQIHRGQATGKRGLSAQLFRCQW